jgi:hypothetical protein
MDVSLRRNKLNMIRKLLFGSFILIISWAVTSCEALSGCKVCKQVTYIDGVSAFEGSPEQYCDAKLLSIETTKDYVTVVPRSNGNVSK